MKLATLMIFALLLNGCAFIQGLAEFEGSTAGPIHDKPNPYVMGAKSEK